MKSSWESFLFASDRLKQSGHIRAASGKEDRFLNRLKCVHSTISGRIRLQPITFFDDRCEASDKIRIVLSDSNDENMKNCWGLQWLLNFPCQ